MRSTSLTEFRTALIFARASALSFALLGACSGDGPSYHPTEPSFLPPGTVAATWGGSWTVDEVTPAGDCLADALNDPIYHWDWEIELDLQREGDVVRLNFDLGQGNEDSEGFWPLEFVGTIDQDGTIVASVPPGRIGQTRTDPWLELCYWEWTMEGGGLSAILSADGTHLAGTITETFRVVSNGTTFTVRSHFTADYR